jgi:hypothetical protein
MSSTSGITPLVERSIVGAAQRMVGPPAVFHISKGVRVTHSVLTLGLPFAYKVMNAPRAFKQEGEK